MAFFDDFRFLGGGLVKKCPKLKTARESKLILGRRIEWRSPFFATIRRSRDIGSESEIRPILAWTNDPESSFENTGSGVFWGVEIDSTW
jgi:hypothetical protein